jgi:hypothetical protein
VFDRGWTFARRLPQFGTLFCELPAPPSPTIWRRTQARNNWAIGNANGLSVILRGNIFYGNGGWGANFPSNVPRAVFIGPNAWGSNTSGAYQNIPAGSGDQTLTATPFTNSGSGDYSLNSTAGGGALLKGTGKPSSFLGGTTTSSPDMGAVQTLASSSSGTSNYGFIG